MISSQTEVARPVAAGTSSGSGVVGLLAAAGVSVGAWAALIVVAMLLLG